MLDLLAAAADTVVQTPTAMQTWGPAGAVIIALGGWRGIAQIVAIRQCRNGNGKRYIDERDCDRRHESEEKVRVTEMSGLAKSMDKLDATMAKLSDKFDETLKELLNRDLGK